MDTGTVSDPCSFHRGPNGQPVEYTGEFMYEPSDFVKHVVGGLYRAIDCQIHDLPIRRWVCFGYDPRSGFWMRSDDDLGSPKVTNVSERAVNRTFHRLGLTMGAALLLHIGRAEGQLPSADKTPSVSYDRASETLRELGMIEPSGKFTQRAIDFLAQAPEDNDEFAKFFWSHLHLP